jgi:hypothetical protein
VLSHSDCDVLVPCHFPIGKRRLVEDQSANGKGAGIEFGTGELEEGAGRKRHQGGFLENGANSSATDGAGQEGINRSAEHLDLRRIHDAGNDSIAVGVQGG